MKKLLLAFLILLGADAFAQQKGISYQAVIINPKEVAAPGYNAVGTPLANKSVCMSFQILNERSVVEYQEMQTIVTDQFGMVNLVIGAGTRTGGTAASLAAVTWSLGSKTLVVGVNTSGNCSNYTKISRQALNYVPFSMYAENANVKDGSITTAKLADGSVTDIKVAYGINKTKVGLSNVDNTSDAAKPVSTATQTALDLKEDKVNKSNDQALGTSTTLYPTQAAVKAYVDGKVVGATTIADADANTKGKIKLAGDLTGTADVPLVANNAITTEKIADGAVTDAKVAFGINKTKVGLGNVNNTSDLNKPISTATQAALNLKEELANKSQDMVSDASSATKYPSVKAIKVYVDGKSTDIQAELDATQTGAGLNTNGTYTANASSNYIQAASSLKDADNKLDAEIKSQALANQLNLDKKLDKVLSKAETIVTSGSNTLSISGLQEVNISETNDQILTVSNTGQIRKTTLQNVFKEYVKDIIATDGQTQFTTALPIIDINKVNVYRNGIRISLTKIDANTIALETGVVCYANDEIKIVQFN